MAIQTSDGNVYETDFDMINSRLFDPQTTDTKPPSLDDIFDKISNDPTFNIEMDGNGNPIMAPTAPRKPTGELNLDLGM